MSKFVIYCEDETEFGLASKTAVEEAMKNFVASSMTLAVELLFVNEQEIQRLNRELRDTDKVTDVLSFPTLDGIKGKKLLKKDYPYDVDEEGNLLIGSIAICVKRAKEQAEEYGHSYNRELHYLLVHGIMHCLGYDHMTDEEKLEMREKEEFILAKLGITRS
jgi:probable rRNA maturation factor